ncbi:hypothetical protein [Deinococcus sp.]|uniref:hypothetical protein n=1 Tax=Deinococcus sp. TaxID=47478 RepID=UPI003C7DECA5
MKRLTWKLPDVLKAHGITSYQLEVKLRTSLALETERLEQAQKSKKGQQSEIQRPVGYSPNTIYAWCKLGTVPERLQTSTLERILRALEQLTGQDVAFSDVLAWEDESA